MQHTKIEWVRNKDGSPGYSWNPIKGLCPEACFYCYARAIYNRFKLDPKLRWAYEYLRAYRIPAGSKIFVCSTMEIFHPDVPKSWRDSIFKDIEEHADLTFIILTKRPELIDRPMPDNVWLGVSIEGKEDWERVRQLSLVKAKLRFVSVEPFLGTTPVIEKDNELDWLIVGRLTGHSRARDPEPHALGWLVLQAKDIGIPIFMKDNLKENWAGPLVQEFPKGGLP